jgi:hypothetical protein
MRPLPPRFRSLATILCLGIPVACAHAPAGAQKSPKEVVEQFYKMETQGTWLGPERWDELQDFLTDTGPWFPNASISVLKRYEVREARKDIGSGGVVDYQVEVDFFEWGSIGPYLNFTKAQGLTGQSSAASEAVVQRTYETLVLRDRFIQRTPSGKDVEKKGTLGWRMALFAPPRIDVNTALRWVAEMRDKSSDPAIKYNAGKTLAILRALSVGGRLPGRTEGTAKESPAKIAQRFIRMEAGLLPYQWNQLTNFFIETPKPQWSTVHIVDVVDTASTTNGDSTEVEVLTNSLGDLDASLRIRNYPSMRLPLVTPSTSACFGDDRFGFSLLLSEKYWDIATDLAVKELDGPLAWRRIQDTSFQPLISLDTAIRYVGQTVDKTTDSVVKRNGARTLSILNYYKQGKPLPAQLSSDATGGCG